MAKSILIICLLVGGCTSLPMPQNAINKVNSINYVDNLNYPTYAFAYADGYDITIKNFNFGDKIWLFISRLNENDIYNHEVAHVYDYWMLQHEYKQWIKFNLAQYNSEDFFDYKRRESFAIDAVNTLKWNKKNEIYYYLKGN